jgi:hypothetical protein
MKMKGQEKLKEIYIVIRHWVDNADNFFKIRDWTTYRISVVVNFNYLYQERWWLLVYLEEKNKIRFNAFAAVQ